MNSVRLLCNFNSGFNVYGTKLMKVPQFGNKSCCIRVYSQDTQGSTFRNRFTRRQNLNATATKTSFDPRTAISIGQGATAGAAVFGLGALAYYGLGLSNQAGIIENAQLWPQYVKERIRSTYIYFGSSILITAASAAYTFNNPTLLRLVSKNSLAAIGLTVVAVLGSGILTQSLDYAPGINAKHVSWILHSAILGCSLSPICFMGGIIIKTALLYTAGMFGAFSTIAVCAPNDKFLNMGGILGMGLGLVFVSSLGSIFLGPASRIGVISNVFWLYGGLIVFSGLLLYDTQRIIKKAETYPLFAVKPYDPINQSVSIYLDTLNLFVRVVAMLSGNNRK